MCISSTDDVTASSEMVKFRHYTGTFWEEMNIDQKIDHGKKTLAIFIPDSPLEDDYLHEFRFIASGW